MNNTTVFRKNAASLAGKIVVILFMLPILGVWTAGSAVCSIIAVIAAVLGLLGWKGISLTLYPGYDLPQILSIPLGLGLALLLYASFVYTRRFLRRCLHYIKS
ncbi:hypothetical protein [Paenibacillus typhae]|uniref:hypothetical protein n=1 Tax=Paenibacillus typhae TaxID=1174501 RepID=UPI001C8D32EA|nr:hypothetical protein [Paenibacillus typhae]MBY0014394.1 hypothetical protein [Paenibacillus typhae]